MRLTARVKKQVFRMQLTVEMRLTTRVYGILIYLDQGNQKWGSGFLVTVHKWPGRTNYVEHKWSPRTAYVVISGPVKT